MTRIPLLLTTKEAVAILRVQRPKIYDLIKGGVIEGVRIGADWRITTASIERLCNMKIPESYFTNGRLTVQSSVDQNSNVGTTPSNDKRTQHRHMNH